MGMQLATRFCERLDASKMLNKCQMSDSKSLLQSSSRGELYLPIPPCFPDHHTCGQSVFVPSCPSLVGVRLTFSVRTKP